MAGRVPPHPAGPAAAPCWVQQTELQLCSLSDPLSALVAAVDEVIFRGDSQGAAVSIG